MNPRIFKLQLEEKDLVGEAKDKVKKLRSREVQIHFNYVNKTPLIDSILYAAPVEELVEVKQSKCRCVIM